MTKSGIPKRRCDHCLDLECLICSHVALYFYKLNREVPETVMKRDTADIRTIASNGWYDWINSMILFATGSLKTNIIS